MPQSSQYESKVVQNFISQNKLKNLWAKFGGHRSILQSVSGIHFAVCIWHFKSEFLICFHTCYDFKMTVTSHIVEMDIWFKMKIGWFWAFWIHLQIYKNLNHRICVPCDAMLASILVLFTLLRSCQMYSKSQNLCAQKSPSTKLVPALCMKLLVELCTESMYLVWRNIGKHSCFVYFGHVRCIQFTGDLLWFILQMYQSTCYKCLRSNRLNASTLLKSVALNTLRF